MRALTIVIVNYNSKDYLAGCLDSIFRETGRTDYLVAVVDNASQDRDFSDIQARHPEVSFLYNQENVGFSRACNLAIHRFPSPFYLLLNPDCVVLDGAVDRALEFLELHPEIGILGCRVENPDGTLQRACRRAIPRPSVALYRLLGLSLLFPRHPRLARYNMSFLDEHSTHDVEAVSGSFLLFRSRLAEQIGLLDEDYFLYGEDLDFCYRASKSGWKITYYPQARVMHFKRRSSSRSPRLSTFHYYDAMKIFYRKHFRAGHNRLQSGLIHSGILLLYWWQRVRQKALGRAEVGSDG